MEKKKYNNFYQQASKLISTNNNHAFIIETGDNEDYEIAVKNFVKMLFSENLSMENNDSSFLNAIDYLDYQEVYPINNIIKKEQLLDIQKTFKTKSINKKRVYVIYNADKLNSYSANTILKFLEEPEEGVIGILVLKNRYQLLDTIISRCQVLTLDEEPEQLVFSEQTKFLIECMESEEKTLLNYNEIVNNIFLNKEDTIKQMEILEKIYYNKICNKEENYNSKKNSIKILKIIEKEKAKLKYNVNFKLWLDNFISRVMEVKNNG